MDILLASIEFYVENIKMSKTLTFLIIVMLTGCVTSPSKEELYSANYGNPPKEKHVELEVKNFFKTRLIDPTSPIYNFKNPYKGWLKGKDSFIYGYWIDFTLNSKNQYGGYTGSGNYSVFFRNDTMYSVYENFNTYRAIVN